MSYHRVFGCYEWCQSVSERTYAWLFGFDVESGSCGFPFACGRFKRELRGEIFLEAVRVPHGKILNDYRWDWDRCNRVIYSSIGLASPC